MAFFALLSLSDCSDYSSDRNCAILRTKLEFTYYFQSEFSAILPENKETFFGTGAYNSKLPIDTQFPNIKTRYQEVLEISF